MKDKIDQLNTILSLLSKVEKPDVDEISIAAGNGYDEASIIATQDSLLTFAELLIRLVTATISGEADLSDIFESFDNDEISGYSTNEIKVMFNELADVWPIELCIVKDTQALIALVQLFEE